MTHETNITIPRNLEIDELIEFVRTQTEQRRTQIEVTKPKNLRDSGKVTAWLRLCIELEDCKAVVALLEATREVARDPQRRREMTQEEEEHYIEHCFKQREQEAFSDARRRGKFKLLVDLARDPKDYAMLSVESRQLLLERVIGGAKASRGGQKMTEEERRQKNPKHDANDYFRWFTELLTKALPKQSPHSIETQANHSAAEIYGIKSKSLRANRNKKGSKYHV